MLCDIHLWCYNSLKAKSGYTLDRLCIRVFILVCDTSALSTASLILPLGLRQACSLFVSSLKSRFFFCCLFLGAEVLSAASLLLPSPPHCLLTSSWDCQLLHKKLMRLLMVRNHLSILLSTYQIQCGDELKWQLWLRWSDRLLSETVWHSQSEALN